MNLFEKLRWKMHYRNRPKTVISANERVSAVWLGIFRETATTNLDFPCYTIVAEMARQQVLRERNVRITEYFYAVEKSK